VHQTTIRLTRNGLANESLIPTETQQRLGAPLLGSGNSKHRRTATRQQGFCCSVLKQIPFDFSQTGMLLEDHILK